MPMTFENDQEQITITAPEDKTKENEKNLNFLNVLYHENEKIFINYFFTEDGDLKIKVKTTKKDEIKNVGPLGGIHASMKAAKNDAVFVFASDMPCISSELVKKHIEFYNKRRCDAAIPRIKDFKEPLHAIYNKRVFSKLDEFLSETNKYSIENFIKNLNVRYNNLEDLEEYKKAFININTPQDLSCMELYPELNNE